MELTTAQLQDLVSDGKVRLSDDIIIQWAELPDEYTSFNDYDCYGKVEWRKPDYYGRHRRPEGFDGMAEIVWGYNEAYWWQPPADLRSGWHNYEHKNHLRNCVREILAFGFYLYKVELCQGEDAYGRPIVVDFATLGGIEPLLKDDVKSEYLADLVAELDSSLIEEKV
jgi:hypothetical protein